MSNYLIELFVIHSTLMGAYWIFFRNETQYGKLRWYLLGSIGLSLTIPLIKLPRFYSSEQIAEPVISVFEPVMIVGASTTPVEQTSFSWQWLFIVYGIISLFFLIRFFRNIDYIVRLERSSEKERILDAVIRRDERVSGSFSFFNWIFLEKESKMSSHECDAVIRHELAHARLGHTADLILLELFKVAFWWLPTAWLAKKELKKIHEYQADAHALKTVSVARYSSILISSTLKSHGLSLASSFHDGLIFKRLKAMKQTVKKVSPWKIGFAATIAAMLFIGFACSEEMDESIQQMGKNSNAVTFDQLPADMQAKVESHQDKLSFIKVALNDDMQKDVKSSIGDIEELKDLDPSTIYSIHVVKNEDFKGMFIALKKDGANFDYLAERTKSQDEVFTIVEDQPEFPGGKEAFTEFMISNMKYPKSAAADGIEGTAYVQFIVGKSGDISNVSVVKGFNPECDDEALRVVSMMPDFKPGKQRGKAVAVKMVLPVKFSLTDDDPSVGMEIKSDFLKMDVKAKFHNGVYAGVVTSAETGKPMPGVNIVEEGTNSGTVSDLDGTFKLKLKDENSKIVLSHVGYKSLNFQSK